MKVLTIIEAEKIAGKRLDRRYKYATTDDGKPDDLTGAILFNVITFTQGCSGCINLCDGQNTYGYPKDEKWGCLIGSGCEECGFTGKRKVSIWVDYEAAQMKDKDLL